jgi:nitrogen fixation-related uncharacterized protein
MRATRMIPVVIVVAVMGLWALSWVEQSDKK